jgi:hypothetical protein
VTCVKGAKVAGRGGDGVGAWLGRQPRGGGTAEGLGGPGAAAAAAGRLLRVGGRNNRAK